MQCGCEAYFLEVLLHKCKRIVSCSRPHGIVYRAGLRVLLLARCPLLTDAAVCAVAEAPQRRWRSTTAPTAGPAGIALTSRPPRRLWQRGRARTPSRLSLTTTRTPSRKAGSRSSSRSSWHSDSDGDNRRGALFRSPRTASPLSRAASVSPIAASPITLSPPRGRPRLSDLTSLQHRLSPPPVVMSPMSPSRLPTCSSPPLHVHPPLHSPAAVLPPLVDLGIASRLPSPIGHASTSPPPQKARNERASALTSPVSSPPARLSPVSNSSDCLPTSSTPLSVSALDWAFALSPVSNCGVPSIRPPSPLPASSAVPSSLQMQVPPLLRLSPPPLLPLSPPPPPRSASPRLPHPRPLSLRKPTSPLAVAALYSSGLLPFIPPPAIARTRPPSDGPLSRYTMLPLSAGGASPPTSPSARFVSMPVASGLHDGLVGSLAGKPTCNTQPSSQGRPPSSPVAQPTPAALLGSPHLCRSATQANARAGPVLAVIPSSPSSPCCAETHPSESVVSDGRSPQVIQLSSPGTHRSRSSTHPPPTSAPPLLDAHRPTAARHRAVSPPPRLQPLTSLTPPLTVTTRYQGSAGSPALRSPPPAHPLPYTATWHGALRSPSAPPLSLVESQSRPLPSVHWRSIRRPRGVHDGNPINTLPPAASPPTLPPSGPPPPPPLMNALAVLDLSADPLVGDCALRALAALCPCLTTLRLDHCSERVTGAGLLAVAEGRPRVLVTSATPTAPSSPVTHLHPQRAFVSPLSIGPPPPFPPLLSFSSSPLLTPPPQHVASCGCCV